MFVFWLQVPSDSSKVAGLNKLLKEDKRAAENHFDQELKRKREQENEMSHEEVRAPFFCTHLLFPSTIFSFLFSSNLSEYHRLQKNESIMKVISKNLRNCGKSRSG